MISKFLRAGLLLFILLILPLSNPSAVFAQACCPSSTTYNARMDACRNHGGYFIDTVCESQGTFCHSSDEMCHPNPSPPPGGYTAGSCCPSTHFWSEINGACMDSLDATAPTIPPNCQDGYFCNESGLCQADEETAAELAANWKEFDYCSTLGADSAKCQACGQNRVWTAFGCISTHPTGFVATMLGVALGAAGAVALLIIGYAAFLITTAAGNPDQQKRGKELITSAIAGILFIIFAATILNFIGIKLFQIPGF